METQAYLRYIACKNLKTAKELEKQQVKDGAKLVRVDSKTKALRK